jgi:hypothetical protein
MLPSPDRTGESTTYPSSAGWQDICCNKTHKTSYQKGNYEFARLGESAAVKQQTVQVVRQVNGVTDVVNNLHL